MSKEKLGVCKKCARPIESKLHLIKHCFSHHRNNDLFQEWLDSYFIEVDCTVCGKEVESRISYFPFKDKFYGDAYCSEHKFVDGSNGMIVQEIELKLEEIKSRNGGEG